MRTFTTQITKQIAFGQSQGCDAVATGCERTFSAAQHLGLEHTDRLHHSRRQLSQLWHGSRSALVANVQNAWQNASQLWNLAVDAMTKPTKSKSYRMPASAMYGMSLVGLVPVAVCRLPVAIATGTPMPRSADC